MGKEAPDLGGTAMAQQDLAQEAVAAQTLANRPTQVTPWGTTTWEQVNQPGKDPWVQTTTLTPELQAAVESQQGLTAGLSGIAEGLLPSVEESLAAPLGWEAMTANPVSTGAEARSSAEEAIYGQATSRLDPYWEEELQRVETQLWNQGLRPGDEAYDTAMGNFERARTDAYQTAMNEAISMGGVEAQREFEMDMARRQQSIAESLKERGLPMEEINMLLTGQTVSMPEMPGFSQAGLAGAPDLLGAELQEYNIQQAQDQAMMSGLLGLATGTASLWGPGLMSGLGFGSTVGMP